MKLVYTTINTYDAALGVANKLLKAKLIACANIFAKGTSLYMWEGEIHEDDEHYILLKTSDEKVSEVLKLLEEIHPYDNHAAIVIDPSQVTENFENWVNQSVS